MQMSNTGPYNTQSLPTSFRAKGSPDESASVRHVVTCTPRVAFGAEMCNYIETQKRSVRKQWIYDIISGEKESEHRIVDTPEFVVLPDTEAQNDELVLNWLVIFKDPALNSIRDLRGAHVAMLEECRSMCLQKIKEQTPFVEHNVICYFHYLPSVFQLHMHVCAPYGQYTTLDICKIHPVDNVLSNLRIDSNYYEKADITTVVIGKGELLNAFLGTEVRD